MNADDEHPELNEVLRKFELNKDIFSSHRKKILEIFCTCNVLDPNISLKEMKQNFLFGSPNAYVNSVWFFNKI